MKTTAVGFAGTLISLAAALSLTQWGTVAAIFGGFGTGIWMLTQAALAIEARVRLRQQERAARATSTP
jgi:type IV secretory pathway TrbD component